MPLFRQHVAMNPARTNCFHTPTGDLDIIDHTTARPTAVRYRTGEFTSVSPCARHNATTFAHTDAGNARTGAFTCRTMG